MTHTIAIIGAGPAGLAAAETLAGAGCAVTIYERMPSPARKFLLAGRGGLNLTHGEETAAFLGRYGEGRAGVEAAIIAHPPQKLREWADGLGETTFAGTSGRVFPKSFKATPLLRAWLRRLDGMGVSFRFRHRWTGWNDAGALTFTTPDGAISISPDATLLALGGASWPRLGSDGSWAPALAARGVEIAPMLPANCGVQIDWTEGFSRRNAGEPLKGFEFRVGAATSRAEAVITETGLEGGAVYALSGLLRAALATGAAELTLDMKPDVAAHVLVDRLAGAKKGETLANTLRKRLGLAPVAIGLLREVHGAALPADPAALARAIKALTLPVVGLSGIERAISTAGGVAFSATDGDFMLKDMPGVFVAGEMLDWDAPTGGYLLQACFSTAQAAANAMLRHLAAPKSKAKKARAKAAPKPRAAPKPKPPAKAKPPAKPRTAARRSGPSDPPRS